MGLRRRRQREPDRYPRRRALSQRLLLQLRGRDELAVHADRPDRIRLLGSALGLREGRRRDCARSRYVRVYDRREADDPVRNLDWLPVADRFRYQGRLDGWLGLGVRADAERLR